MSVNTDREPRVARIDPADADPAVRESFDNFVRVRGKVPNLFRISARRPQIGRTLAMHLDAVMGAGEVEQQLKELLAVRVSQVNGCDYCLASHTVLAKRYGATEAQIVGLAHGDTTGFDPAWRAALEAAGEATSGGGRLGDDTFDRLAAGWSEDQIVEIVAVIGLFNYFNRFANALDIPVTK
jgi:uncharacterized peroxidase-related enzyme